MQFNTLLQWDLELSLQRYRFPKCIQTITSALSEQTSSWYAMERKCLHRYMPPLWPVISAKVV